MNKKHLLIIDDDKEILSMLDDYFNQHGFKVTTAANGLRLKQLLRDNIFDCAILDVMLPGIDGLSLCQQIRQQSDMPILMLSAANTEADQVAGLELGADDYIAKPFSTRELLARIKAHLRRSSGELANSQQKLPVLGKIQFSGWLLDRETRSLIGKDKVAISLSAKEYDLLIIFLEHPQRILSREQLSDLLYDKSHTPFDRSIDVLIARLRKKIEKPASPAKLLKTIRGGGYQLNCKVKTL